MGFRCSRTQEIRLSSKELRQCGSCLSCRWLRCCRWGRSDPCPWAVQRPALSTGSGHPNKTAFCSANVAIDKATAKVTSEAGLLAVVKTHSADLKAMKKDAPAGAVGATVRKVVAAVDAAIASGNANDLNNVPNGAAVDTYCGVDGEGTPLPKYFATGKGTTFCVDVPADLPGGGKCLVAGRRSCCTRGRQDPGGAGGLGALRAAQFDKGEGHLHRRRGADSHRRKQRGRTRARWWEQSRLSTLPSIADRTSRSCFAQVGGAALSRTTSAAGTTT